MWRQMRILNSFTLEATFSGTSMNKNECRHFNIGDFVQMGHVLCQSVLEYQLTQESKQRQTEIVLEMTRYLTYQILERKNLGQVRLPNLRALAKVEKSSYLTVSPNLPSQEIEEEVEEEEEENSDEATEMTVRPSDYGANSGEISDRHRRHRRLYEQRPSLTKRDVDSMIDNASMKTMDGCLKILAQLNVHESIQESDSSDSDSESEAELKQPEPKVKKKKRKSKKQRDKEQQERKGGSGGSEKKGEDRSKVVSALPTISTTSCLESMTDVPTQPSRKSQSTTSLEKYLKNQKKEGPHFISKYDGRRNGGIPCFAEERSIERAAKRMAEMKKRSEEEKNREMAFFQPFEFMNFPAGKHKCVEDGFCQCSRHSMPMLRRSLTHDELQRRLQVALNEGTPNVAQTLVGFNVRTGYTHADSFRDMAPSVMPAAGPQRDSLRGPTMRSTSRQMSNGSSNTPVYSSSMVRTEMLPPSQGKIHIQEDRSKIRSTGPLSHFASEAVKRIYKSQQSTTTELIRSKSDLTLSRDYMKLLMQRVKNNL